MNSFPEIYLNTTPKKPMKSYNYQSKSLRKEKNNDKQRKSEFVVLLRKMIFACIEIYSDKTKINIILELQSMCLHDK